MESGTYCGDFIDKSIWRLSGNFIYHVLTMKSFSTLSPYNLHTNHSRNYYFYHSLN